MIVSEERWHGALPHSFEAFFFPATPNCQGSSCERKTREAHAAFLSEYPQSGVPLLTLDPNNWEAPFAVAPPAG